MTDWLYEATNAQARLEHANSKIAELEKKLEDYRSVLHIIATDQIERSQDKIRWQRDHYKSMSSKILGYHIINQQGVPNNGKNDS